MTFLVALPDASHSRRGVARTFCFREFQGRTVPAVVFDGGADKNANELDVVAFDLPGSMPCGLKMRATNQQAVAPLDTLRRRQNDRYRLSCLSKTAHTGLRG